MTKATEAMRDEAWSANLVSSELAERVKEQDAEITRLRKKEAEWREAATVALEAFRIAGGTALRIATSEPSDPEPHPDPHGALMKVFRIVVEANETIRATLTNGDAK